jgi:signal peptidase I
VLLSILTSAGLGQLYAGQPRRALGVLALWLVAIPVLAAAFMALGGYGLLIFAPLLLAIPLMVFIAIDAGRQARKGRLLYPQRWKRLSAYLAFIILVEALFLVEAFALRRFWVQAFRAVSPSMVPTLLPGDHFMVDKRPYAHRDPKAGDVVVFRSVEPPPRLLVHRIAAGPREKVEYREQRLLVNGRPLGGRTRHGVAPVEVPPRRYFVVGDNLDGARDSRFMGTIPRESIIGKVTFLYYSEDPVTHSVRWARIGKRVE